METDPRLVSILKKGGIAVVPTDTLYGIVARADDKDAVYRVRDLKGRDKDKPFITLIGEEKDLEDFSVKLNDKVKSFLKKVWPGKVSVILPILSFAKHKHFYLHGGSAELAFRLPDVPSLRDLIKDTGPLIAPSANPQGAKPAETVEEAKTYFGDLVDYYADLGRLSGEASTLVRIDNNEVKILRRGAVDSLLFL